MTTRAARIEDVQHIVKYLEEYHYHSNLKDMPFDKRSMSSAVRYYIDTPKHQAFVYTKDNKITGVLLGSIEPFMFNEKRSWATDLLFVADEGGLWLLKRFVAWAKQFGVDRIIMGISSGDDRAHRLYESVGLVYLGNMYAANPGEI